jgi:hypothetical protein
VKILALFNTPQHPDKYPWIIRWFSIDG